MTWKDISWFILFQSWDSGKVELDEPTKFKVKARYVGYTSVEVKDVLVKPGTITFIDLKLELDAMPCCICTFTYHDGLINRDPAETGKTTLTRDELRRMIR